jgi:phage baseplate assembly protein W
MAISHGYILEQPATVGGTRPYAGRVTQSPLGFGLLSPFRRDKRSDFAAAGGVELVKSCLATVLGVECSDDTGLQGELPWRPRFGSLLYRLRHRPNDDVLKHIARVHVADAIKRWEPRVFVKSVTVSRTSSVPGGVEDTLIVQLKYDIISSNVPGNQVFVQDIDQVIEV